MTAKSSADFRLTFETSDDCLYAFVSGPKDNLSVSKQFWAQVHAKAVETGSTKILVEEDFPNQVSTTEMFEVGEFIAKTFGPKIKIAHVDKQLSNMDLNMFAEVVATNRSLFGRVFNNREEAENWLKE